MSYFIIEIKESESISALKRILKKFFSGKVQVLSNEEYRDSKFAELLDEGLKTKQLSEKETIAEFKKRGINIA